MSKSAPFTNTFLYSIVEAGTGSTDRGAQVAMVDPKKESDMPLVRVYAGALTIYLNVATARSLATQIMSVTSDGDLLWDTEPATGEEVDRWTEDLRAGAIGGDPA